MEICTACFRQVFYETQNRQKMFLVRVKRAVNKFNLFYVMTGEKIYFPQNSFNRQKSYAYSGTGQTVRTGKGTSPGCFVIQNFIFYFFHFLFPVRKRNFIYVRHIHRFAYMKFSVCASPRHAFLRQSFLMVYDVFQHALQGNFALSLYYIVYRGIFTHKSFRIIGYLRTAAYYNSLRQYLSQQGQQLLYKFYIPYIAADTKDIRLCLIYSPEHFRQMVVNRKFKYFCLCVFSANFAQIPHRQRGMHVLRVDCKPNNFIAHVITFVYYNAFVPVLPLFSLCLDEKKLANTAVFMLIYLCYA